MLVGPGQGLVEEVEGAAPLTPQGSSVQGEGMAMGAWGRAQEATAVPQTPLEHSSGVGKRE